LISNPCGEIALNKEDDAQILEETIMKTEEIEKQENVGPDSQCPKRQVLEMEELLKVQGFP
jgi:hypothetical protein